MYQSPEEVYSDLGCAKCTRNFEAVVDPITGVGSCVNTENIPGCVWQSSRPEIQSGTTICIECSPNWILAENYRSCSRPQKSTFIKNCGSYIRSGCEVVCHFCRRGYSLSEDKRSCIKGCPIDRCQNCEIVAGQTYCRECVNRYTAIYNPATLLISECLGCDEINERLNEGQQVQVSQPGGKPVQGVLKP